MPAGQRSGSHAQSVWPYLQETRLALPEAAAAAVPAEQTQAARSPSWGLRLLARLRGDREAT